MVNEWKRTENSHGDLSPHCCQGAYEAYRGVAQHRKQSRQRLRVQQAGNLQLQPLIPDFVALNGFTGRKPAGPKPHAKFTPKYVLVGGIRPYPTVMLEQKPETVGSSSDCDALR